MPFNNNALIANGANAVLDASANVGLVLADILGPAAAFPITYQLQLFAGVTRGAENFSIPAIDASTGMNAGAVGYWFVNGIFSGAGGNGADGGRNTGTNVGAGGGGAGSVFGAGGISIPPALNGSDGTATLGGSGAAGVGSTGPNIGNGSPQNGGDAVLLNHSVIAVVAGQIRGGGGGGGAGIEFPWVGGPGGDLDQDGIAGDFAATPLGNKGYAVRYNGPSANFAWSGGGVIGTIG